MVDTKTGPLVLKSKCYKTSPEHKLILFTMSIFMFIGFYIGIETKWFFKNGFQELWLLGVASAVWFIPIHTILLILFKETAYSFKALPAWICFYILAPLGLALILSNTTLFLKDFSPIYGVSLEGIVFLLLGIGALALAVLWQEEKNKLVSN